MSERREGWYWVMEYGRPWKAAYWAGGFWFLPCDDLPMHEDELDDVLIGPRIPTPDEPWQCVPVEPTEKMIKVLCQAMANYEDSARIAYRHMIAAALKPEDENLYE